jgi:tetratricopeptide (TPR) repeat protein
MTNRGLLAMRTGDYRAACEYAEDGLRLLQLAGERTWEVFAHTVLGHAYLGAGRHVEAEAAYRQAALLHDELGEPGGAVEPLAGLARAALAGGDVAEACARIGPILVSLEAGTIDAADDPLRVYLTCWQVLCAAGDPRAEQVLRQGFDLLQARAARIDDARMRQMFLEHVPHHREIAETWRSRPR